MPAATFTKAAGSSIYWSNEAIAARPFGFLPASLTASPQTLAQVWADSGGVFFAASAPIQPAAIPLVEQELRGWLVANGWPGAGQRLLWVTMDATGTRMISVLALAVTPGSTPAPLAASIVFDFAGYLLDVQGAALAPSPAGDALLLQGGIVFAAEAVTPSPATYPLVGRRAAIPLAGPEAGCLSFAIALPNDGSDGAPTDFERLSVGIRYGWAEGSQQVSFFNRPTIAQPAGTTTLWAALQPVDPLLSGQPPASRFSFVPPGPGAGGQGAPTFLSTYLSPEGWEVALTPTTGTDAGTRPGGLAFGRQPIRTDASADAPCRRYLTLDGDYSVSLAGGAASAKAERALVCGMASLELVGPPFDALRFVSGPAFCPAPGESLTNLSTTAWLDIGAWTGGTGYCSQPDAAPFYTASGNAHYPANFLVPVAIEIALPAGTAMPMLGYAGLTSEDQAEAIQVEQWLSAARTAIAAAAPPRAETQLPPWGMTPQGLIVGFEPDNPRIWKWMGLGNVAGVKQPDIAFSEVTPPFQQAVQNAAPFVVLADPSVVLGQPQARGAPAPATIGYALSAQQLTALQDEKLPCFAAFNAWAELTPLAQAPYASEQAFLAAIKALATPLTPAQQDVLLRLAGKLQAVVDGWTFELAPRTWPPTSADQTSDGQPETRQGVMVIKMDRTTSLRQWIDQLAASSWPEAAALPGGTVEDTRQVFLDAITVAEQRRAAAPNPAKTPYDHFLDTVLIEPTWTGTLMLGAAVPLDTLPPDLQAIRAGIKQELFYAHHVGFEHGLVNVDGLDLALSPDRVFGVIDYEDPADLVLDPSSAQDFQFKALQLTIGFERSQVASFVGRVELFVNRLFGATVRKYPTTIGNNLVLDGVKVMEAGDDGTLRTGYRFGSDADNSYQLFGSAMFVVDIQHCALSQNGAAGDADHIVTDFTLSGGLMFQPSPGTFDMFSYGPVAAPPDPAPPPPLLQGAALIDTPFGPARVIGTVDPDSPPLPAALPEAAEDPGSGGSILAFSKLIVRMTFALDGTTTFQLVLNDMTIDPAASSARPDGLAARLPAAVTRFVVSSGQSPQDLGYGPASCGVQQAKLGDSWYGLEYDLPLGTLGALGGNITITLKVLAAWSVDADAAEPPVFLGVQLPGAGLASFELALQGILKLGFGAIQFDTYPMDGGGLGYLLRLRDFGLHVLGVSFPKGHINVLITGGTENDGATKLGWFAGYVEPESSPPSRTSVRRRLASRAAPAPQP